MKIDSGKASLVVSFFFRKPFPFHISIEQVFDDIISHLPSAYVAKKNVMYFFSKGFWNRIKIALQARKTQGDINHVTGDIHFATLLLQKNKTILTIHDCRLLDELHGFKYRLFRYFWFELPIQRSRYVTVISFFTLNRIKHHLNIDDEKIKVIPVAVDERFKPCPKIFNEQKPVILQVGTVINKNLHGVAAALSGISCHLRIIGSLITEDLDILKQHKIDYSNVSGLSKDAMIMEYQHADMLIFASTYEGFGLPIVEAQSVGRPVITSNIASMPEVAGDAACLVDPFNVISIREGILKIIQDSSYRDALVQKGFLNILRFRMDDIIKKYTTLYDTIACRN